VLNTNTLSIVKETHVKEGQFHFAVDVHLFMVDYLLFYYHCKVNHIMRMKT